MDNVSDSVTVYRSMDQNAKEDCEIIVDLLSDEGIPSTLHDDSSPGVPSGVFEVRVAASQSLRAEELIAKSAVSDEMSDLDDSPALDLESIFHSEGSTTAEFEAGAVKNVLESNGISAFIVGDSVLPNFPFEVRVAREHAERARQLVAEAVAAGPSAAEAGELESEHSTTPLT